MGMEFYGGPQFRYPDHIWAGFVDGRRRAGIWEGVGVTGSGENPAAASRDFAGRRKPGDRVAKAQGRAGHDGAFLEAGTRFPGCRTRGEGGDSDSRVAGGLAVDGSIRCFGFSVASLVDLRATETRSR